MKYAMRSARFRELTRVVVELQKKVEPVKKLDSIAERVMLKPELHEFVEMIQYWDATQIQRLKDISYGYVAGQGKSAVQKETRKLQNAG